MHFLDDSKGALRFQIDNITMRFYSDNMPAVAIHDIRRSLTDDAFIELKVWEVPAPVRGSDHRYKYRLALVVNDHCVLRYDNEAGKGDHKHLGVDERETPYVFVSLPQLLDDFFTDVATLL